MLRPSHSQELTGYRTNDKRLVLLIDWQAFDCALFVLLDGQAVPAGGLDGIVNLGSTQIRREPAIGVLCLVRGSAGRGDWGLLSVVGGIMGARPTPPATSHKHHQHDSAHPTHLPADEP